MQIEPVERAPALSLFSLPRQTRTNSSGDGRRFGLIFLAGVPILMKPTFSSLGARPGSR
jgi:hypothetical protein